jgi:hypothetical protein
MRKNSLLLQVVITAVGSLIGMFIASLFCPRDMLNGRYSLGDVLRDWIILSTGAVLGGLLFSWASKRSCQHATAAESGSAGTPSGGATRWPLI